MRSRSTVSIIDLEMRVLVAYRAADGLYGEVPPMSVFDEMLDQRLRLMASAVPQGHDGGCPHTEAGAPPASDDR